MRGPLDILKGRGKMAEVLESLGEEKALRIELGIRPTGLTDTTTIPGVTDIKGISTPPIKGSFGGLFKPEFIAKGLNLQALSLNKTIGPEFGGKAMGIGKMFASPILEELAEPGIAILETGTVTREEREEFLKEAVDWIESVATEAPLFLAVRSSPVTSAPGIANSIIYVGLNSETVIYLAETTSVDVAYRAYATFIKSFAKAVAPQAKLDKDLEQRPEGVSWEDYTTLLIDDLERNGIKIPEDPYEQLMVATKAVADSMKRAGLQGGYILQQAVVIGDENNAGAGVFFTRSQDDGSKVVGGRFAGRTGGADVVTGSAGENITTEFPLYSALTYLGGLIEKAFGDAFDVEFAVKDGLIRLLQARPMKFSTPEVQISVWKELVSGGLMTAKNVPKAH